MVLMSAPVAWLSVGACWAYFAADWKRALTLGLYSGARRLPAWLARPAGAAQRATAVWRSWRAGARGGGGNGSAGGSRAKAGGRGAAGGARRGQGPPSALQRSGDAAPLMYHWALMTAVALLAMHVNVATRFLSACPPLHWHAAEVLARRGAASRLLWLWCLAYLALGCLLFPNFYPWT